MNESCFKKKTNLCISDQYLNEYILWMFLEEMNKEFE